jgi:parallel beta-helix repeat protein
LNDSAAEVEFTSCRIESNQGSGFQISGVSCPTIDDCKIRKNSREAIHVYNDASANVTNCDLSENTKGAWRIADGCLVRRNSNYTEQGTFNEVQCPDCDEVFEAEKPGVVVCPDPACNRALMIGDDGRILADESIRSALSDSFVGENSEVAEVAEGEKQNELKSEPNENTKGSDENESRRRKAFAALIDAQDNGMQVSVSKQMVCKEFHLTESELEAIEAEGIGSQWPPL